MDLKEWSEDTYTMKDVVDKLGLPNLVLVSEGFLSEDDGDLSFGSGDVIQLNFVKQIPHFIAVPLENDTDICYGKEILIPVGYRGNVNIVEDIGKVYDSVQGLVDGRPRFVRTESSVVCIDINNSEVVLPAGVTLELKQNITGKTVMCKYGGNSFTIDVHQSGHFSLLPDNTEYLLADMISRLPVTIKFVNSISELNSCDLEDCIEQIKTFSGIYRLVRVTCEDYIVGFYRQLSDLQTKCFAQTLGTVALLPLENATIQQLEVHVSLTKQTSVETHIQKMCNHNENIFSNEETVTFLDSQKEEDDDFEDLKPIVPPRTYRRLQSFSSNTDDIEKNNLELVSTDEVFAPNVEEAIKTAISSDCMSSCKISDDNEHGSYNSITKNQEQAERHYVDDGYCMLKDILPLTGRESSPTSDDTNSVIHSAVGSDQHTTNEVSVSTICDTTEGGYSIVKFESQEFNQGNLLCDTKEDEPGLTKSRSVSVSTICDTTEGGYSIVKFESQEFNQGNLLCDTKEDEPGLTKSPSVSVSTICDTTEGGYSIVKFESQEFNQGNLLCDTKEDEPGLTKSPSVSVSTICDTTEGGYSIVKFESQEFNQGNLLCDTKEDEPGLTKSCSDPLLNTDGPKDRKIIFLQLSGRERDASKRKTFKRSMKEKMEKLSSKLSKIHIKREDSTDDERLHRQNSDLQSPTLIKDDFHSMSVSEVAQCFRLSELPTMATICEKEELDGQFFIGLTIGYLTKAFDLSNIDALKVQKLSKGWRPQNDIEDDESFTSF